MRKLRILSLIAPFFLTTAGQTAIERTDVNFDNGDIVLSGTLVTPAGKGPFPGIVLVHGSGPGGRQEYLPIASGLAAGGLAVLVYDKRGSGQSEGNWVTSSLYDLAADAAVALDFLRKQDDVDANRAGLWGISQGGWIVPLAANLASPSFSIIVTGGGASPRDVETANYLAAVSRIDDSPDAIAEATQLIDAYMSYLSGDTPNASLMEVVEEFEEQPWFDAMGIEHVIPGPGNRPNWEWVATFEPAQSIRSMNAPVLVLLGARDPLSPVERSDYVWTEALSGNAGSKIMVIPGAGHGLRAGGHGGDFIDGYFEKQLDWLRSIGILTDDGGPAPDSKE